MYNNGPLNIKEQHMASIAETFNNPGSFPAARDIRLKAFHMVIEVQLNHLVGNNLITHFLLKHILWDNTDNIISTP